MRSFLLLIFTHFIFISNNHAQIWAYSFTGNLTPSPSNGSPSILDIGTTTHNYFTGINTACNSTDGEPANGAYSRQGFDQNDGWEISYNATNMSGMSFGVCLRVASLASTTTFTLSASPDGGSTFPVSSPITFGSGTSSAISGGSLSLTSAFDNASNVIIRILRTSSGGATTVRIDNAILNGTILPIELSSFEVIKAENIANVTWTTTTETNNDYFTIERSADGRNFSSIGKVDGAGNSSSFLNYSYIDNAPLAGTSYYRLKQTDYDGQFSYSDVVRTVKTDRKNSAVEARIQGDMLKVKSNEHISIILYSMDGRVLGSYQLGSYEEIDISHIPNQIIIAKVLGAGANPQSFKLSKNN